MKRVVIYARVSTSAQDTQSQVNDLQKHADKEGLEIVKIYKDEISGLKSIDERKELLDMVDFVISNKIDMVLVWEISRLSRKTKITLEIIDRLSEKKINLYIHKDRQNTLNQDGTVNHNTTLLISILSSIANVEATITKERSKRGLREAAEKSHFSGKFIPYGYKKEGKKLIINEDEIELINKIFDLYIEGNGTQKIANYLNDKKITTRFNNVLTKSFKLKGGLIKNPEDFKFVDGTIYSILKNPIYKGFKRFKNDLIYLPNLQIIDENKWDKVTLMLKSHSSKKGINSKFFYPLQNIKIICGVCGKNYFPHKRTNGKDNRYICLSKRYKEECNNIGIGIDKLNDVAWFIIRRTDLIKQIEKSIENNDLTKQIEKLNDELKLKLKDDNNVTKQVGFLIDNINDNPEFIEVFQKKLNVLKSEKNNLKIEIDELSNRIMILKEDLKIQSDLNEYLRRVKKDAHTMKDYLYKIIKSITIYPCNNEPLLSNISNDKNVYIEFLLYSSIIPVGVIVSHYSINKVIRITKGEYNKEKMMIVRKKDDLENRIEIFSKTMSGLIN
jgi:DNA invertase Pin-like site-specific DNA recombinase